MDTSTYYEPDCRPSGVSFHEHMDLIEWTIKLQVLIQWSYSHKCKTVIQFQYRTFMVKTGFLCMIEFCDSSPSHARHIDVSRQSCYTLRIEDMLPICHSGH